MKTVPRSRAPPTLARPPRHPPWHSGGAPRLTWPQRPHNSADLRTPPGRAPRRSPTRTRRGPARPEPPLARPRPGGGSHGTQSAALTAPVSGTHPRRHSPPAALTAPPGGTHPQRHSPHHPATLTPGGTRPQRHSPHCPARPTTCAAAPTAPALGTHRTGRRQPSDRLRQRSHARRKRPSRGPGARSGRRDACHRQVDGPIRPVPQLPGASECGVLPCSCGLLTALLTIAREVPTG
jgi:hypothetical protein